MARRKLIPRGYCRLEICINFQNTIADNWYIVRHDDEGWADQRSPPRLGGVGAFYWADGLRCYISSPVGKGPACQLGMRSSSEKNRLPYPL